MISDASTKSPLLATRLAYGIGVAMMLAGLVQLVLFSISEGAVWDGPLGYRKLVIFGLSTGLTVLTLAWMLRFFPAKPRLHSSIILAASASLTIEIVVITIQSYRGVPSHFNVGTPLDAAFWAIMAGAIFCFSSSATLLSALSFSKLDANPAMKAAIRASLLIFLFSQLSGFLMIQYGMNHVLPEGVFRIENIATSTTVGAAGNLKLPHALSLHAIQALPALAFLLIGLPLNRLQQQALVWTSGIGFAGFAAYAQIHAYTGRSILDSEPPGNMVALVSAAAFAGPFVYAIIAQALRFIPAPKTPESPARTSPQTLTA